MVAQIAGPKKISKWSTVIMMMKAMQLLYLSAWHLSLPDPEVWHTGGLHQYRAY